MLSFPGADWGTKRPGERPPSPAPPGRDPDLGSLTFRKKVPVPGRALPSRHGAHTASWGGARRASGFRLSFLDLKASDHRGRGGSHRRRRSTLDRVPVARRACVSAPYRAGGAQAEPQGDMAARPPCVCIPDGTESLLFQEKNKTKKHPKTKQNFFPLKRLGMFGKRRKKVINHTSALFSMYFQIGLI